MNDSRISSRAFIGPEVTLGENVAIGPGAVILGPCVIEDDVWIGPGAQIGAPPEMSDREQNAAWAGELLHAGVRICSGAVIRENAVIHQGSYRTTTIGPGTWVLSRAYIAHDVLVGAEATLSAGVSVGGHCVIGDRANIGMNVSVHQRRFIGAGTMIGMGTPIARDVPPYTKAFGSPARVRGINTVGLSRSGVSEREITELVTAYSAGDFELAGLNLSVFGTDLAARLSQWITREDRAPMTAELSEG